MKQWLVLLIISFSIPAFKTVHAEALYQETRPLLHTFVEIKAWGDNSTAAFIDETFREIERVNALLNNYDPASEVSSINTAAGGIAVPISDETYRALCDAKKYARISNGAFDFTVGPLVALWGFNHDIPGLTGPEPDEARIARVRKAVDYRALALKKTPGGATARLERPGMRLDTGAFGKGVVAEHALQYLKNKGIHSALIAVGGTISATGLKPGGEPWQIGIRHPRDNGSFLTIIELRNQSVSTSGDYEKFYYKGGKRHTHIIDPRTGRPVSTVQSVTVIAPRASASDALSTALFVLGPEEGLRTIEKEVGIEALIVGAAGEVVYSSGWPQKIIVY